MTAILPAGSGELRARYDHDIDLIMLTFQPATGSSASWWVRPEDLLTWALRAAAPSP